MRQLLLNRIALCAQAVLMVFAISVTAVAAPGDSNKASDGSEGFNHAHTGYQLTGAHAVAVCETCHAGGIFEGTPVECDGCHAVGRRVAATPMSTAHIVTTAACDSCHFNTVSFLGARFNHGMASPGGCDSCHNGRTQDGRPGSHNSGSKLTASCDSCHRTTAWLPATWNHAAVLPGGCDDAGCHVSGSNQYFRQSPPHTRLGMTTYECDDCHVVFGWYPNNYKHNAPGVCSGCHNDSTAVGKPGSHTATAQATYACDDCHSISGWQPANYKHNAPGLCSSCHASTSAIVKPENRKPTTSHFFTTECDTCHSKTTWQGASYHPGSVAGICGTCHNGTNGIKGTINDPNGTHIPFMAGGDPNCDLCHTSTTTFTAYRMNHSGITTCNNCHNSTSGYVVSTKRQIGNHQGSTAGQDCSDCHTTTTTWQGAMGAKPANHIPYNTGVSCGSCHIGGGVVRGPSLHVPYLSTFACTTCHLRGNRYLEWGQDSKGIGHEGWSGGGDCSQSGCHRPRGTEGNAYINWD